MATQSSGSGIPPVPLEAFPVRRLSSSLALVLAAVLATSLGAQQSQAVWPSLDGKEPKRPRLEAGADTNDAGAYRAFAMERNTSWKKSFDAYYWGRRLDPSNSIYLLDLRQAVYWGQSPEWRREYALGAEFATKSKESRLIDSLDNTLFYREPFAHYTSLSCTVDRDWLDYIEGELFLTALHYHEQGCYTQAAQWYTKVLAKSPRALGSRMNLVRVLYYTGQYGTALAQIDTALAQIRERDTKRTYRFYSSKEQLETMRGEIFEAQQDFNGAKKAYGKALEENMAYWPAHVRLARLASMQEEHAEALQEYDQAVQLAAQEPTVHFDYGVALLKAEKAAEAEREFRRAIELEPYYSLAYFNLALALDNQGKRDDAVATYRDYLTRAPRRHGKMVTMAKQRLAVLAPAQTSNK